MKTKKKKLSNYLTYATGGGVYNPSIYGQSDNDEFNIDDPYSQLALNKRLNPGTGEIAHTASPDIFAAKKNKDSSTQQPASGQNKPSATVSSIGNNLKTASSEGTLSGTGLGKFINSSAGSSAISGVGAAANLIGAFSGNKTHAQKDTAIGSAIGTGLDAAFLGGLPVFSTIGGLVGGLIGGGADKKIRVQDDYNTKMDQSKRLQLTNLDNNQRYGANFYGAEGGEIMNISGGDNPPKRPLVNLIAGTLPDNSDPYWKTYPLLTQHDPLIDESTPWGYKPKPYVAPLTIKQAIHPDILLSDKALGQSSTYYPSNSQPIKPSPNTIKSNSGYYEDGGEVSTDYSQDPTQGQQGQIQPPAQPVKANIERGELVVNAQDGKIIQDFKNPNRFSPHSNNPNKEPMGNFVELNQGDIVISKKFAKKYKDGDDITKQSILRNILEQQKDNPAQNIPESNYSSDTHMAQGGVATKYPLNADMSLPNLNDPLLQQYDQPQDNSYLPGHIDIPTNIRNDQPMNTRGKQATETSKVNLDYYLNRAAPYIPQAFNIALANQPDQYLSHEYNTRADQAQSYLETLPTTYDVGLNLHKNQEALNTSTHALRDYNSPSTRVQASEMLGRTLDANSQVINTKNNAEGQLKSQKAQLLSDFINKRGASEQNENLRYQQEERMNEGARRSELSQAYNNIAEISQQQFNDSERIRALNSMTDYKDLSPGTQQLIQDDPNSRDKILRLVNMGYSTPMAVKMVLGIDDQADNKKSKASEGQRSTTKTETKTGNQKSTTTNTRYNRT